MLKSILHLKTGLTTDNLHKAWGDIVRGWQHRELWSTMAFNDTRQRYRRSMIGPFWMTLSMGIFIAALGLLYAGIFKQPLSDYLPFVASGFIVWGLVSTFVLDSAQVFTANEGIIRQLPAPLSLYVYKMVWGNIIVFAHNLLIYVIVAIWFGIDPGLTLLLAIPGVLILSLNGVWLGILLGLISARFRDVPQILASMVQVAFFLTPIIWRSDMLEDRAFIVDLNPFYHLVEIVRAPMLGQVPTFTTIVATLTITLFGWVAALLFFTVYRWRIAYWV